MKKAYSTRTIICTHSHVLYHLTLTNERFGDRQYNTLLTMQTCKGVQILRKCNLMCMRTWADGEHNTHLSFKASDNYVNGSAENNTRVEISKVSK